VVIRVPENLPATGDVLVRIKYRGIASNRVRVGIGQSAVATRRREREPTPGLPSIDRLSITADESHASDVQTIIQQAASAATSLSKPVTIVIHGS
jgi:hypothetical protein